MSNQEMQFADPDWKPTQPLEKKTNSQEREAFIPQPINADPREQSQWRTAPPSPPQQEGYTGLRPYAGTAPQQMQGGNFRQRQYQRRGRGPWFWIILAIIIISLTSGGFGSYNGFDRFRGFHSNASIVEPHNFTVSDQAAPTIVINDRNGNIQVHRSDTATSVSVQDTKNAGFFGNPNDMQVSYSQSLDGNTINASVNDTGQGSVDFDVTVPQDTNLQITTNSGDINVDGVSGQMTLSVVSGDIHATNDTLSGQDTIKTDSGDIKFDGSISTSGTYHFQTVSGSIDLTVPGSTAFHVDASTNSGSIASDFPGVHVQNNNQGPGSTASGDVGGTAPGATIALNTDSGAINLHQQ
jgi:putative adhesin